MLIADYRGPRRGDAVALLHPTWRPGVVILAVLAVGRTSPAERPAPRDVRPAVGGVGWLVCT